jgi:hypothetical protein
MAAAVGVETKSLAHAAIWTFVWLRIGRADIVRGVPPVHGLSRRQAGPPILLATRLIHPTCTPGRC